MRHLLTAHQQESFLPFSSRQSLSCCLSRVAKSSTPKPHGPLYSPSEPCGPSYPLQNRVAPYLLQNLVVLFLSPQNRVAFSPFPQNCMVLPIHSRTVWSSIYFRTSWSSSFPLRTMWSSLSMAAEPRFKSQHPSSFRAPFLTPPTVSYTYQHPPILPALLGCHSKSGQVWPHGMEPIISKLSRRPCNQGELLPSPILGRICSHSPGSKHGHSYLTHP